MKIAQVKEMKQMDEIAIRKYGISDNILMENAGLSVFQIINNNFKVAKSNFIIFCGIGNNGGDGLVVARKLFSNGANIKICILDNPEKYKNAAMENWNIIKKLNLPIMIQPTIEEIKSTIDNESVIIDAIFGTGLTRNIKGYYYNIIQLINQISNKVISIDIPSGIDGNTGQIKGIAIRSNYTVTFGLPKIGNILYPGYVYGGRLYLSHISFPPELYNTEDLNIQVNSFIQIPERSESGHKGTFGNALFISGSKNYFGAPYFSSLSFLKTGGGYSRLATPASMVPFIASKAHEVVFLPQKETSTGSLSLDNFAELKEWSKKVDVVIIGPGLSLEEETQELIRKLTTEIKKPLLIDGDGLTAISKDINILKKRNHPTILTPHPGEMARLTKVSIYEVEKNRINITEKYSKEFNSVIVLKGAHTIIGLPCGKIYINMTGNNGMASAGSGDVLTGTIGAMYALGLSIEDAVKEGVLIHGFAGDLAAKDKGKDGTTASDIMDSISDVMKTIRNKQNINEEYNFIGLEVI